MENYIFFFVISLILIGLFHYCYEKIKSSIVYCNNYIPNENYKYINDIIHENHDNDSDKQNIYDNTNKDETLRDN